MTQTLPAARTWTEPGSIEEAVRIAKCVIDSGLTPSGVRSAQDAFLIIATGAELGMSPMRSLQQIHVVNGKTTLSATAMVALCKRSPLCEWFRSVESTDRLCTVETKRAGCPEPTTHTFTIEMAERAGLTKRNPTWRSYPHAMLYAAASRELARREYPDLVGGFYEAEEVPAPEPAEHAPPLRVVSPPVQERPTQEIAEVGAYWIGQLTAAGIAESNDDARHLLWSRAQGFAEGKVTAEDVAAAGKAICLEAEGHVIDVEDQSPPAALGDSPSTFGEAQSEVMDATGCSDLEAEQAIVTAREILDTEEWGAVITKAVSLVESRREKGAA